ncbi:MAG: hypothetical protein HWE30_17835 [Methylocystaceae bacterium]|nr:hypothetical protein [Methylocystaceae bacterium]
MFEIKMIAAAVIAGLAFIAIALSRIAIIIDASTAILKSWRSFKETRDSSPSAVHGVFFRIQNCILLMVGLILGPILYVKGLPNVALAMMICTYMVYIARRLFVSRSTT